MKLKFKNIFCSWDFILSITLFVLTILLLPYKISNVLAKEIYTVAITVLSITFPVFFAALTAIITSSDDQFAIFLDSHGLYKPIINTFKYSLYVIFIALMLAIALSILTTCLINVSIASQPKWTVGPFGSIFIYSLLVGFNAIITAIKYADFRIRYLKTQSSQGGNL